MLVPSQCCPSGCVCRGAPQHHGCQSPFNLSISSFLDAMELASAGGIIVGFTASLITIAALVVDSVRTIHALQESYKTAPNELKRLARTAETLDALVSEIKSRSNGLSEAILPRTLLALWATRAENMRLDLQGLQEEIGSITKLLNRSDTRNSSKWTMRARVRIFLHEESISKYERLLSSHIDTFNLMQSMINESQGRLMNAHITVQSAQMVSLSLQSTKIEKTLVTEFERVQKQLEPKVTPIIRMHAFQRNIDFVGQHKILKAVKEGLERKADYQARFALWGLGGIGKTQIATEFCYRDNSRSIFWVFGNSDEKFSEGYRNIAIKANIPGNPAQESQEIMCLRVKDWLESAESGNWILVIDNMDLPMLQLQKFIPTRNGAILFTTRDRRLLQDMTNRRGVEVTRMTEEDALNTFRQLSEGRKQDTSDEEVAKLLSLLDNIPLAIAQAAAFIWHTGISVPEYVKLFMKDEGEREDAMDVIITADDSSKMSDRAIMRTWEITASRISLENPSALKLLQLFSFLDPRGIPRSLVRCKKLPELEKELDFIKATALLHSFAMVTNDANGCFRLHALVSFWTRRRMSEPLRKSRIELAVAVMLEIFPKDQYDNIPLAFQLAPHASLLSEHSFEYQFMATSLGDMEYLLSGVFLDRGQLDVSLAHATRCLEVWRTCNCNGAVVAKVQNVIGQVYWRQENPIETLKWFRLALESLGSFDNLKQDNAAMLQSLKVCSNLGDAYRDQRSFDEAEEWYFKALNGKRALLGKVEREGNSKTILLVRESVYITVDLIGKFYTTIGKLEKAKEFHEDALTNRLRIHGPNHWRTLDSMLGVARVYKSQKNFPEALSSIVKVFKGLETFGASLSSRDQLLNETTWEVAYILEDSKNVKGAEKWYRRALCLQPLAGQRKILADKLSSLNADRAIDGEVASSTDIQENDELVCVGSWFDEKFGRNV